MGLRGRPRWTSGVGALLDAAAGTAGVGQLTRRTKDHNTMIEKAGNNVCAKTSDSSASLLAVDRVLELVAVFTIVASLIGLVAALAGVFHAPQVLIGSLIVTGVYWFKTIGHGLFPGPAKPRWWHIALLVLVALFFRLPAYHYTLGAQDEGLYTNIAQHIDHTHSLDAYDHVMQRLEGSPYLQEYLKDNRIFEGSSPTLYLLGVYARQVGTSHLVFQFYYMFSVWMAIMGGLLGPTMSVYALTFFALLSVVFFYRLALLLTGSARAALMAGGLLALCPLHVYFSKFPVTEVPTLAFSLMGFTLLASYWSAEASKRSSRWLWWSVLAFLCLFTTRISGFMYIPFFVAMAIVTLVCDSDPTRSLNIQRWAIGTAVAYFVSVAYGMKWSRYYSRDTYLTSFEPLFGHHWKVVVELLVVAGFLTWIVVGLRRRSQGWPTQTVVWISRHSNRWSGVIVLFALIIGLLHVYWLGWTNHYAGSETNLRWHMSGLKLHSASTASLWTLCVFLSPPMVLAFLMLVWRRVLDPRVGFLQLFVAGFWVFGVALQWDTPYSPYYARYLLSELAPYLILFVVCTWAAMGIGKAKTVLSMVLAFGLVYSTTLSATQIGKNEDDGAYAALARLVTPIDPDDVILLDTLDQQPDTSLVKTPLVYTFNRNVVTVGDEALSNAGYLAKLDSLYDDVFLISSSPVQQPGFTQIDSVRFKPLTYAHNHSFPYRLVAQADVVLYLYRLDNPRIPLGHSLSFAEGQPWGNWLQKGWGTPEAWGVWSDATQAVIAVDPVQFPAHPENLLFHFKAQVYVTSSHPRQRVQVSLDGAPVASYEVTYPATTLSMRIPVTPSSWVNRRKLMIGFGLPNAASPASIGASGDPRKLALGLISLTVTGGEPAQSTPAAKPIRNIVAAPRPHR
jgi:hypothetical protein